MSNDTHEEFKSKLLDLMGDSSYAGLKYSYCVQKTTLNSKSLLKLINQLSGIIIKHLKNQLYFKEKLVTLINEWKSKNTEIIINADIFEELKNICNNNLNETNEASVTTVNDKIQNSSLIKNKMSLTHHRSSEELSDDLPLNIDVDKILDMATSIRKSSNNEKDPVVTDEHLNNENDNGSIGSGETELNAHCKETPFDYREKMDKSTEEQQSCPSQSENLLPVLSNDRSDDSSEESFIFHINENNETSDTLPLPLLPAETKEETDRNSENNVENEEPPNIEIVNHKIKDSPENVSNIKLLENIDNFFETSTDEDSNVEDLPSKKRKYSSDEEFQEIQRLLSLPVFKKQRRRSVLPDTDSDKENINSDTKCKEKEKEKEKRSINCGTEKLENKNSEVSTNNEDDDSSSDSNDEDTDTEKPSLKSKSGLQNDDNHNGAFEFLLREVEATSNKGSDDSNKESDYEETEEPKKKKKCLKRKRENKEEQNNSDDEDDAEPFVEKSLKSGDSTWKKDSLLTGALLSDTDVDVSKKKKCDTVEIKKEDEIKENISSNEDKADCYNKIKENLITLISTDDSDIEFIPEIRTKKTKEPICINDSDSEKDNNDGSSPNKKSGRRNIRAVLSCKDLEKNSKIATIEEAERVKRLESKTKSLEDVLSQTDNINEFILDFDSETQLTIKVNEHLSARLKNHQKEGVKFMWNSCYESVSEIKRGQGSGCILAHCMGLGKTFQVIALIHTLFKYEETNTKHVLIVCPLSTVFNWKNEFKIALKVAEDLNAFKIYTVSGQSKGKEDNIKKWRETCGVLIMGYERFTKETENLDEEKKLIMTALIDPGPDLVVCDEGHLLKNGKTCRTKALMRVKTKRRIVLTGTPLQNNLKEYYYMVQFVKPNLLGNYKEYSNRFVNPITNGQYDDSTREDILLMKKRSHVLHKLLKNTVQRYEVTELESYLPKKLDYVLFVKLNPLQAQLYKYYVDTCCANESQIQSRLFLHHYILQLIATHPYLLKLKEIEKNKKREIDVINYEPNINEYIPLPNGWWRQIVNTDFATSVEYGSKLKVVLEIIEECEKIGDKLLIFSTNMVALDSVEYFIKLHGTNKCKNWKKNVDYLRMDGTVPPHIRNDMCNTFNDTNNLTVRVLLVSHKVGGLGLNLIAANRVILLDVNWNPAYDIQSIFRTYRFGQVKRCFVYRLVSMGTMEEVIYERSVTKSAIAARVVDQRQITRHYKCQDLQEMFRFNVNLQEERPQLKLPDDDLLAHLIQKLPKEIFRYHEHQQLLENRPDEELNASEMALAWDEFNKENAAKDAVVPIDAPNNPQIFTPLINELTNGINVNIKSTEKRTFNNFIADSNKTVKTTNFISESNKTLQPTVSNLYINQKLVTVKKKQYDFGERSYVLYNDRKTNTIKEIPAYKVVLKNVKRPESSIYNSVKNNNIDSISGTGSSAPQTKEVRNNVPDTLNSTEQLIHAEKNDQVEEQSLLVPTRWISADNDNHYQRTSTIKSYQTKINNKNIKPKEKELVDNKSLNKNDGKSVKNSDLSNKVVMETETINVPETENDRNTDVIEIE